MFLREVNSVAVGAMEVFDLGRQDAARGVMQFRHGLKFARWDQSWDQRVHFGALLLITYDDLAQQTLISSNHQNAFHTAW